MDGVPLPDTFSGDVQQRPIRIDRSLFYVISGALAYIVDKQLYVQTGTMTVNDARAALADMLNIYFGEGGLILPVQATIWADEFINEIGASVSPFKIDEQMYNMAVSQSAAANDDTWVQKFVLDAGDYVLSALSIKADYDGIVDFLIDGDVVGTEDYYSPTTDFNQRQDFPFTLSVGGIHELAVHVTGKNASSSDYFMHFTKLWIKQDA